MTVEKFISWYENTPWHIVERIDAHGHFKMKTFENDLTNVSRPTESSNQIDSKQKERLIEPSDRGFVLETVRTGYVS